VFTYYAAGVLPTIRAATFGKTSASPEAGAGVVYRQTEHIVYDDPSRELGSSSEDRDPAASFALQHRVRLARGHPLVRAGADAPL